MEGIHIGLSLLLAVIVAQGIFAQFVPLRRPPPCETRSCFPTVGDLLIGRENNLTTNSTCGMDRPERYCIVSHLDDEKKCFMCDSRQEWARQYPNSHRIENIISSFSGKKYRWWQAENGIQNVYIQLDLEAEFQVTHIIMTFRTFRPKAMYVERSLDFGKSWNVYRYFAYDCAKSFPGIPTSNPLKVDDVVCDSKYSEVVPSTLGEVILKILQDSVKGITDPYSQEVQNLLKLTNLRIVLTELHTLGDIVFDGRADIKEKYYYALYDMTVRGSCSCYGHAYECGPVPGYASDPNMVNGLCQCKHHTTGRNCEMCEEFYHDLPWRPGIGADTNACKRCECYNHATTCHFDAGVYELTGRVSGGVCDDCQHNTAGRNCQECLPYYYQDPNQDLRSPDICRRCDCDPFGARDLQCEERSDPEEGLEAGRCLCKSQVTGDRCDSCLAGYCNMTEDNPDGCQACTCNAQGTLEDFVCDPYTCGCICKRYVHGTNCDECMPGFWGLSNDVYGCASCDCDFGGAIGERCDQITGQCECKPHIQGRQCNQVQPGYFYTTLDWYTYEAEFAQGSGNYRVSIREPFTNRMKSWTGPGFMRITEGDSIIFSDITVDFPMYYDIVIRYEHGMEDVWEDIRVSVIRDGPTDPDGPCANVIPQDDQKTTTMQRGARYTIVNPPSCLEHNETYSIRIDFNKYRSDLTTPEATARIDSIVLVPNTDSIPIFQGSGQPAVMKNQYIYDECMERQMHVPAPEPTEYCKTNIFTISAIIHGKALACECDPTGSLSYECDSLGGQCQCKPNVVGRKCDQCAVGTYGFGPNGCQPCNCHNMGARDNFCNIDNGQCLCIPNVHNRVCDQCQPGFYGFPHCRPCNCNGNAETCDNLTGACDECSNYTAGTNCERCMEGYYGDPRINVRIPCQACMCPGGPDSMAQHADSCYYDRRMDYVVCACDIGFKAPDCGVCDDNYFGNPMDDNGTCSMCDCNNNINPDDVGNCDPDTGECLKCLFNTEGFNCEKCQPGYYGDALTQSCTGCICNEIGTNASAGVCDRVTGQCPCLPNVVGLHCDASAPNHYNMTPGEGSKPCNCDPTGSYSGECNEYTGQCDCKPDRGGRTCSDCADLLWGDPLVQCYNCACDPQGSASLQCDRRTGQCDCLLGISGYKCDRCDRGTTGDLPNCVPCGECFNNWDRVVRDLRSNTESLIEQGRNIQIEGASGAFDKEFRVMEDNLAEIKEILDGAGVSSLDVQNLENMLKEIRANLTDNEANLKDMDEDLQSTMGRIQDGENRIRALDLGVSELNQKAQQLRRNASDIQAQDVEGAYNITKEAEMRSAEAKMMVDNSDRYIEQSANVRDRVENMIEDNMEAFNQSLEDNEKALNDLNEEVDGLRQKITEINTMVCDGTGDPCDDVCGGGGCGVCGGASCPNGAITKADNALDFAMKAETILKLKEDQSQELHTNVSTAHDLSQMARQEAQMAFEEAEKAKRISEDTRMDLELLLNDISAFISGASTKPSDIELMAEEVLNMRISRVPEEILDLAQQINTTIQGLQNIEDILEDTKDNLTLAQTLKERADNASKDASSILLTARGVLNALNGSSDAQQKAVAAIKQADTDIYDAQTDLTQIESETGAAEEKSQETMNKVDTLKINLVGIQSKINENEFQVQNAENEANQAADLANKASKDALDLEERYPDVLNGLNKKYNSTADAKARVEKLREKANNLAANTTAKLKKLENMNAEFSTYEKQLQNLSGLIDELNANMTRYLEAIQQRANDYRTCTT